MRASTAFFTGAGTIIAAIAIGLGGGLIAGNVLSPTSPGQKPETSKLQHSAPAEKVAAGAATVPRSSAAAGSPGMPTSDPVPYVAETERAGFGAVFASSGPQGTAANPTQASTQAAATSGSKAADATAAQSGKPAGQPAASSPDNAYAKANDADVKREAADRRRAERHRRWVERHRNDARDQRDAREQTDWGDVERNVREDSYPHEYASRPAYRAPRNHFFGGDDND